MFVQCTQAILWSLTLTAITGGARAGQTPAGLVSAEVLTLGRFSLRLSSAQGSFHRVGMQESAAEQVAQLQQQVAHLQDALQHAQDNQRSRAERLQQSQSPVSVAWVCSELKTSVSGLNIHVVLRAPALSSAIWPLTILRPSCRTAMLHVCRLQMINQSGDHRWTTRLAGPLPGALW